MKSDQLSYLWLIIGAILLLFANGNWIVPIATWLFPIFIIRFLRDQKRIWGIILCALAFTGISPDEPILPRAGRVRRRE